MVQHFRCHYGTFCGSLFSDRNWTFTNLLIISGSSDVILSFGSSISKFNFKIYKSRYFSSDLSHPVPKWIMLFCNFPIKIERWRIQWAELPVSMTSHIRITDVTLILFSNSNLHYWRIWPSYFRFHTWGVSHFYFPIKFEHWRIHLVQHPVSLTSHFDVMDVTLILFWNYKSMRWLSTSLYFRFRYDTCFLSIFRRSSNIE